MKRIILLMTVCLMGVLMAPAQTGKTPKRLSPDESTIYKDSTGNIISKETFDKIMKAGNGKLGVNPVVEDDRIKEFQIKVMTDEEIQKRNDRVKQLQEDIAKNFAEIKGKQAPAFEGLDLDGNKVSLSDLKGKVIVLKFWFTKCGPCLAEMPELNKMLEENYKNRNDVVFLAPCLDDQEEIKTTLKAHPFNYRSLCNMKPMAHAYKVLGYPSHFVIDKNGEVTLATISGRSAVLTEAINKALAK